MIEAQDISAAVKRGLITEAQAAELMGIADARRQARDQLTPSEEPFVLFKGFNEIFIVIGLTILFVGWAIMAGAFGAEITQPAGADTVLIAAITLVGLGFTQRYFTVKRRMIAPSISLAIKTALTAAVLGWALADYVGLGTFGTSALGWGVVSAVMLGHYRLFHVPFGAAIIATALFSAVWSVLAGQGILPGDAPNLLHMSKGGSLALFSILFGLVCFALAMRFDMSDPHRISTRATTGFWLHVVAAPAIMNTVALRLLENGQSGHLLLLVFLLVLAFVAIVIDRRSFLVSGAGYAVWLTLSLFDGSAMVIFFLGLGLVLLGAQWERLRSAIMRGLPSFPGKDRLPPYGSMQ